MSGFWSGKIIARELILYSVSWSVMSASWYWFLWKITEIEYQYSYLIQTCYSMLTGCSLAFQLSSITRQQMAFPRIQQMEMSMTDLRRHQPGLALLFRPGSRPGQPDKVIWERTWRSTNADYGSFAGAVPTRPLTKTLPREELWRVHTWDTTARTDLYGARVKAGQTTKPPRRLRDHLSRDTHGSKPGSSKAETKGEARPLQSRPTAPTPSRSSEGTASPEVDFPEDGSQRSFSQQSGDVPIQIADGREDNTPLSHVEDIISPEMDLPSCSPTKSMPSRATAVAPGASPNAPVKNDEQNVNILDCSAPSETPCHHREALPYSVGKSPWRVPLPRRSLPSEPTVPDKQYLLSGRGLIAMEHSLGRFWAPGMWISYPQKVLKFLSIHIKYLYNWTSVIQGHNVPPFMDKLLRILSRWETFIPPDGGARQTGHSLSLSNP